MTTRFALIVILTAPLSWGSDCTMTSVGFPPLNDLGTGLYMNLYEGGLYPGGSNDMPGQHAFLGGLASNCIEPLNRRGEASPDGAIVLLSIGMSNARAEFEAFIAQATEHPDVDTAALRIVNGAFNGQDADNWTDPDGSLYDLVRDERLADSGVTEAQVQAVWLKEARGLPEFSLPHEEADAFLYLRELGDIVRALKVRYPNLQMVFLMSRVYAGYASSALNPEPFAYETGFSVKWLIESQINQVRDNVIDPVAGNLDLPDTAPWLAWGPYLWADGTTPRNDGLTWECSEFRDDGTHPSETGNAKVAGELLAFFLNSEFTRDWFRAAGCPKDGDVNGDERASPEDALLVLEAFLETKQLDPCAVARGDVDDHAGLTPNDARVIFTSFLSGEVVVGDTE